MDRPSHANHGLEVLGHRGVISDEPADYQNSLSAFRRALSEADGFETDACQDAEGEIYLIHEAKYVDPAKGVEYCLAEHLTPESRMALGDRRLEDLSSAIVKGLRLKNDEPIPTLMAALALVGQHSGKTVDIELKGFNVVRPVLRKLTQAIEGGLIKKDAILVSSFNLPALQIVRNEAPACL